MVGGPSVASMCQELELTRDPGIIEGTATVEDLPRLLK